MSKPPFRPLRFAEAAVQVVDLPGGGHLLRSPQALQPYPRCLGDLLEKWARAAPQRTFLAERAPEGSWRQVTYGEALPAVRAIAQALLDRGLGARRPVLILSDNSLNFGLLLLGALHAGVPVAPVSPSYSLLSKDFARLKAVAELVHPGLVYAADGARFAPALAALGVAGERIVVDANPPPGAATFGALLAARPGPAVDAAFAAVGPDTVAKILFTSGSTGMPKGVINTQRMLCSNMQALHQIWPFLAEKPPVLVDWTPWNHTFGGNFCFGMILFQGGTFHIDGGKPAPGLIEKTAANLSDVAPTVYLNVPRGYDMLLPFLERDAALRRNFFSRLDLIFYAGAALPQNLWARLEALSIRETGGRVAMISSWGSTETAPMATSAHYPCERSGVIGLPVPGTEIKLTPSGGKLELRVRGPNVTPGYWGRDDLTREAFDGEGFYRIGDAGRFADPADPAAGLEFDGRIAEDFKLTSGTWVHTGALRVRAIAAAAPVAQDAVVTGHDRAEVGLLIFPNPAGLRALCPDLPPDAPLAAAVARPEVRARIRDALRALAAEERGSSLRPTRALLLEEPPQVDGNEITDKGYINQRAVLTRRAALVERLYAEPPAPDVITP
jgi:feruloyl-CoA synthase